LCTNFGDENVLCKVATALLHEQIESDKQVQGTNRTKARALPKPKVGFNPIHAKATKIYIKIYDWEKNYSFEILL